MMPPPARSSGDRQRRPGIELVHPAPRSRARLLASAFIGAWLLGQLAVPASYHLNANASEERFAWRMFSDVWWYHKTCQLSLVEILDRPPSGEAPVRRPVALERAFHVVWLRQLQRRPAVVEKALHQRCDLDPAVRGSSSPSLSRGPAVAPAFGAPQAHVPHGRRRGGGATSRPGCSVVRVPVSTGLS